MSIGSRRRSRLFYESASMTTHMPAAPSLFLSSRRTREELDADYLPSRFVSSMADVITDWTARSQAAKSQAGVALKADLAYGPHPRERIDYYASNESNAPLLVFIHGGFWKSVSKDDSAFVAPAWMRAGAHVAVVDYVLAPEVTLAEIVAETIRALAWLVSKAETLGFDPARMVLAGHSAGGHLAALSQTLPDVPKAAGLVLLSGVFELEPIRQCYVNDVVAMTEQDVVTLSPARRIPLQAMPIVVAVGELEPTAFHEQSRHLAWSWRGIGCAIEPMLVPRRTHFSILDDFADPAAPLGKATARLLGL
jgi:arylformamidase